MVADLIFLVDTSDRISFDYRNSMIVFIKSVIDRLVLSRFYTAKTQIQNNQLSRYKYKALCCCMLLVQPLLSSAGYKHEVGSMGECTSAGFMLGEHRCTSSSADA